MNVISTYSDACLPGRARILGINLRPLSLGHILIMQQEGLKWVSPDSESPSIESLVDGLFVCSQTYEDYIKWREELNDWEKPQNWLQYRLFKFLQKNESFILWPFLSKYYYEKWENDKRDFYFNLAKQSKKVKDFNIMEHIKAFGKYMEYGSRMPMFFVNERKMNASDAGNQWAENVYVCLVSELGYTPEQAHNMPLNQAMFEYLKIAEKNGSITFGAGYEEIQKQIEMNKNLTNNK